MKNTFIGLLAVILVFSCSNLEEEVSIYTEDNFFRSEENIEKLKEGVYAQLAPFAAVSSVFGLQEVSSDEFVRLGRGTDWGFDQWYDLHQHKYHANHNATIRDAWNFLYRRIDEANRLIGLIESGETEIDITPYIAELKTLRALLYYWLIDLYGNVPIITAYDGALNPATQDRAVVFDFIEEEIIDNLPYLNRKVDISTYGKVNYYVAQTLLAKLYLNAEIYKGEPEWEKTIAACEEVINSGFYQLENDFFTNFKIENQNSSENIFVIPYDSQFLQGFFLSAMTLHPDSKRTFNLSFQPWNSFTSIEAFYRSFDEDDDRINSFLVGPQYESDGIIPLLDSQVEPHDPDGPQINYTPEINGLNSALRQEGARVGKFQIANGRVFSPAMDNDFPIFRFADVLMMKAEALWRLDPDDDEALILMNQVRERSNAEPFSELNADVLLAERGREFFCEAWRRSDLIRFGKYNDAWWEKPEDPSDHVNLFPIPNSAIYSNPNLRQNPGY
jgi:hypothetical protein